MEQEPIDLGKAEMKFNNFRRENGHNRQIGTTYLVGRYIIMECENEMDAFEAYRWFRDSERLALESLEGGEPT